MMDTLILYATNTGNAKSVAKQAYKYYKKNGLKPKIHNVSDFPPENLREYSTLLMVVSTAGKGTPPPQAQKFFKAVHSEEMPELPNLHFSVCALGDTSYPHFCEAGKEMDRRLKELKANPLHPRVDCDADFSDKAVGWIKNTWHILNVNHVNQ